MCSRCARIEKEQCTNIPKSLSPLEILPILNKKHSMFEILIPHVINLIQQKKINIPPTIVIQTIHREKHTAIRKNSYGIWPISLKKKKNPLIGI